MNNNKYIAVLITVHNRVHKTIACLDALFCTDMQKGYYLDVFIVDDGSSDGTSEIVISKYPNVNIIYGDGKLYWNRGMHLAWETANKFKDFDYYLWLNDDTLLCNNAVDILLQVSREYKDLIIVVGSTYSSNSQVKNITYGGRTLKNGLVFPVDKSTFCDYFNGNIVLISKHVYNCVGNLDPIFHHELGDFDYGLRAKKKGIKSYVVPNFIGVCDLNVDIPLWRNPNILLLKRFKYLYSPLGCNPIQHFIFEYRHFGLIAAVFHFFTLHLRALMPAIWKS